MHLSSVAFGLLALVGYSVQAAAPPSCTFKLGSNDYDLSALSSLRLVESVVQTPPTETIDRVRMVLCGGEEAGLGREEGVDEQDQCPVNTYVCLQKQNSKPNSTPPLRTLSVIPVVGDQIPESDLPLKAEWKEDRQLAPGEKKGGREVSMLKGTLSGGKWNDQAQTLSITLYCSSTDDSEDDPRFVSYVDNTLSLFWNTQSACALSDGQPPTSKLPAKPPAGEGRGFWGWFFILLLLIPPVYLGLGIWHNRTTYDAKGWDAIPHRQFWEEVPMLLRDLSGHVFGSMRRRGGGGSSRSGYESL